MTAYTSNTAVLTVLPPAAIEDTGWTIQFVSDLDLETVWAHTADFTDAMFGDELSDAGGFSLTMRADDPLWERALPNDVPGTLLEREVVVRFVQNGQVRFEGFLEDIEPVEVDEGPRLITLSGRGLAALLERGIVVPPYLDDPFEFIYWDRDFDGPAMSAFLQLKTEAHNRGVNVDIDTDFTATLDSHGVPWVASQKRTIAAGMNLLSVLTQLCDSELLQWRFLHGYRALSVADEVGQHVEDQVIFFIGRHLERSSRRVTRRDIVTDVYVQAQGITNGYAAYVAGRTLWGRRERWIVTGAAKDKTTANLMAAAELGLRGYEQVSRSIVVSSNAPGRVPFDDYRVGDWVGLETESGTIEAVRVVSLAVRIDGNGADTTELTLQSKFDIEEVRTRKALARLGQGTLPSTGGSISGDQAATARIAALSTRSLTDVSTTAPASGQTLVWNASLGLYVPSAIPAELPTQTGNAGKFLKTDGSVVTWDAPAGGGGGAAGLIVLAVQSFSAASVVNINGVFTALYANYKIVVEVDSSTGTASNFKMKLRGAGVDDSSAAYRFYGGEPNSASGTFSITAENGVTTGFTLGYGKNIAASVEVWGPARAVFTRYASQYATTGHAAVLTVGNMYAGSHDVASAFDGFSLIPPAGTITGRVIVYAYGETP